MTTIAEAQTAIRDRLTANFTAIPLRFKNEPEELPDTPTAFAYVELIVEDSFIAGFGGGRFNNLHRTTGRIEAQVLVPVGTGIDDGYGWAEDIAAVFRSYRDDDISCFAAEVFPADGRTEDGSYDNCAVAIIDIQFDKTG